MARAPGPFFFFAATSVWAALLVPGAAADISSTLDSLWASTTATDSFAYRNRKQAEIRRGSVVIGRRVPLGALYFRICLKTLLMLLNNENKKRIERDYEHLCCLNHTEISLIYILVNIGIMVQRCTIILRKLC